MIAFLADENFRDAIIRGIRRRKQTVDLLRIQDVKLAGAPDPELLAWAAREGPVLLTHDLATVPRDAWAPVAQGLSMPGVLCVSEDLSVAVAVEDLLLIAEDDDVGEWDGRVRYLPLILPRVGYPRAGMGPPRAHRRPACG